MYEYTRISELRRAWNWVQMGSEAFIGRFNIVLNHDWEGGVMIYVKGGYLSCKKMLIK